MKNEKMNEVQRNEKEKKEQDEFEARFILNARDINCHPMESF